MNIVQIARLLFATTFLSIFCYLIFFWSVGYAGNGGEYWGFDGYIEPWKAAQVSFEDQDFRFLQVNIRSSFGTISSDAPAYQDCENHPFGRQNALWPSSQKQLHGGDSLRLAIAFARRYNETMTYLLADQMNHQCEVLMYNDD